MNKQELTKLVEELLADMGQSPQVKGGEYKPTVSEAKPVDHHYHDGEFVEDVSGIDLRKLYLTENPADKTAFAALKSKTPARLGSGRAGPRYKTITMLRFRADHAAAQDAVFSEAPADFAQTNHLVAVQTRCKDKDEYLTRPDLGRRFDEENAAIIRKAVTKKPTVQIVIGDGLSSAAICANAMDCMAALQDGLKVRNIDCGTPVFVRYCRVGAGDAVGDITGCDLVCVLVGERPGLVTDKSMSVYLTYKPHSGISESTRTVVSNIHDEGTPAVEAGAYVAELCQKILEKKVSGVGLHLEDAI